MLNLPFPFNITHHGLSVLVATDISECLFENIQLTDIPGLPVIAFGKFCCSLVVPSQNWQASFLHYSATTGHFIFTVGNPSLDPPLYYNALQAARYTTSFALFEALWEV